MKRGLVIAGTLLVALGLWFVLTWNPAGGEDAASAVERIRRSDYPPGTRGVGASDTWALEGAPPVSPDSTGKDVAEDAELTDGGRVHVLEPAPR